MMPRIRDGMLAFRLLGPCLFLQKLRNKFFSQVPFLMLGKELDTEYVSPASHNEVTLLAASPEDVAEFFRIMAKESKVGRYDMLARKTFYDKGFHDCYIGRTLDSNEMCSIVWQVTFRDVERTRSENLFPELRQDEAFQENIYTLEKYRGKGIMGSTGRQLDETARKQGFKRMFNYTREDNIPPLRASKGRGLFIYARVLCCYFLFKKKNRIIERFDPPIPISVPHKVHS